MRYWMYYLVFIAGAWLLKHPAMLVGVVIFFALRRFIPDPWVLLRTAGHIGRLKKQIRANPANVTARRDLARIYLQRLRPKSALKLLDEARQRFPQDAELLFLTGLARFRSGQYEEALEPLVEAVQMDPRVGFGEAYLVAGDALGRLKRHPESIDAYDRYVQANSSSIEGWLKLARAHEAAGEDKEAHEALDEALTTWSQVPGYQRRKQFGWFLRARLLKLFS